MGITTRPTRTEKKVPKRSYIKREIVIPTKSHESIPKKILKKISDNINVKDAIPSKKMNCGTKEILPLDHSKRVIRYKNKKVI